MVIVLLTPELLLGDGNSGFEPVRNYDPYIAMFRAQAKLVVISDSWRSSHDFLNTVKEKKAKVAWNQKWGPVFLASNFWAEKIIWATWRSNFPC